VPRLDRKKRSPARCFAVAAIHGKGCFLQHNGKRGNNLNRGSTVTAPMHNASANAREQRRILRQAVKRLLGTPTRIRLASAINVPWDLLVYVGWTKPRKAPWRGNHYRFRLAPVGCKCQIDL